MECIVHGDVHFDVLSGILLVEAAASIPPILLDDTTCTASLLFNRSMVASAETIQDHERFLTNASTGWLAEILDTVG